MEEESNRSSQAMEEPVTESSRSRNREEEENRNEKSKKIDEHREVSSNNSSECTVDNNASIGERGESRASQSETLASVPLTDSDFQFDESSHHLSEVPVEYSLQPLPAAEGLKDQVRAIEGPSKGNTGQSAQLQHQIQVPDGPSRLQLSTPVAQSISSISNPTLPGQELQPFINGNKPCPTEEDKHKYPGPKPLSAVPISKTPSDGYNWRKYGQKQVKSPEGFRSYYRCTYSDCYAKKIECCDRYNNVTETVYRSHHNHDPPQKLNSSRENRPAIPIASVNGSHDTADPGRNRDDLGPSTSLKEPSPGIDQIPETKQQKSNDSDETSDNYVNEEYADGSESKKRQKKISVDELGTLPRPGNKPKFVVHAAVDAGISGDGYRWRKYGQKMVKGNPHPRNYYRCTSAGCPVRKHTETAVDNKNTLVITYKGGHNHDMPVPRKRHGSKNTPPFSATSPVSVDNFQINKTTETHQNQIEHSVDKESKATGEASTGATKASESTRTLLSIGFEIKPC